jgi:NTE family protein
MGPPMTPIDVLHQTPQPIDETSLPGRVVLVMQGGGAPGSYQAGAYQALHEAGIEPDWVIGTSIGAINGAIITGNKVVDRVKRLKEFWAQLDSRVPEPWSQLAPLLVGVPGFYQVNPALAWGADARVGIEQAAMYLVDPLKKLLPAILDFDLINSGKTRFTLGLTTVQTGQMRYFDNKKERIGLEHVLGSSALPPCFPAVLIDGEYCWDGGVYSNSPIEVVFDQEPRRSSIVFAIQIWHTRGPRPESLSHAFMREKDILFGTRSKTHIMRQAQLHRMRRIIRELVDMLPEEQKRSPRVKSLPAGAARRPCIWWRSMRSPSKARPTPETMIFRARRYKPAGRRVTPTPAGCWSGGRGMIRSIQRPTLLSTNPTRRPEAPSSWWKNLGDTTIILLVAGVLHDKNDHHM